MKKKMLNIVSIITLVLALFSATSCNDNDVDIFKNTTWISEKHQIRLYFNDADKTLTVYPLEIKENMDYLNAVYTFSQENGKITLQYKVPNKLLVQPSTHSYSLRDNELTIDFTNGCYGFDKEKYVFVKQL